RRLHCGSSRWRWRFAAPSPPSAQCACWWCAAWSTPPPPAGRGSGPLPAALSAGRPGYIVLPLLLACYPLCLCRTGRGTLWVRLSTKCLSRLRSLLRRHLHRVSLEGAGGRELAQLVSHHILGHIHRDELLPVLHRHGVPHELRKDGGSPRPGAHPLLLVGRRQHRQLGFQVSIGKRSLLYASAHSLTSSCSCG